VVLLVLAELLGVPLVVEALLEQEAPREAPLERVLLVLAELLGVPLEAVLKELEAQREVLMEEALLGEPLNQNQS
jgi:hypothetical protein